MTCPQAGGATWRALTSEHFVLVTDLPENEARRHLAADERFEEAFELLFGDRMGKNRLEIVEFSRRIDFLALGFRFDSWFERRSGPDGHGPPRLVVGPMVADAFTNALAHRFLAGRIPFAPPWLSEGFAQYYQTVTVLSDKVEVGFSGFAGAAPLWIGDVLTTRGREFYGSLQREKYRTSWALVHMLSERDGPYAARYTKYFAALAAGACHDAAWSQSFGDVPLEKLQDDLVAYMKSATHELLSVPYEEKPLPEPEVRVLSDVEVHLIFLELRRWYRSTDVDVQHDLAEARRQAPDSPDVAQWAALLAMLDDREGDAEAELQRAIASGKDDERLRFALARLHDRQAEEAGASVTLVEPEFRALTSIAQRYWALNSIAWVHALADHPTEGLPLARRAVALEPTCYECRDTLALLEFEAGDVEAALAEQVRAVDMVNDRAPDPTMLQHLELYRKRVAEKRGTPPRHAAHSASK